MQIKWNIKYLVGWIRKMKLVKKQFAHPFKAFICRKTQTYVFIDCLKKGNESRYVKHNDKNPNSIAQEWLVNNEIRLVLFALRDICPDEMITIRFPQCRPSAPAITYPVEDELDRTLRENKGREERRKARLAKTATTGPSVPVEDVEDPDDSKPEDYKNFNWFYLPEIDPAKIVVPNEIVFPPRPHQPMSSSPLDPNSSAPEEKETEGAAYICKVRNCGFKLYDVDDYNKHFQLKHAAQIPKLIGKIKMSSHKLAKSVQKGKEPKGKPSRTSASSSARPEELGLETLVFYPGLELEYFPTLAARNQDLMGRHQAILSNPKAGPSRTKVTEAKPERRDEDNLNAGVAREGSAWVNPESNPLVVARNIRRQLGVRDEAEKSDSD